MGSAEYWSKGSRVEVTSKETGFKGAWFDAIVVEPPVYHKSKYKKKRLTLIEYTTLLSDDGDTPLREYSDAIFIRPLPPGEGEEVVLEENLVVDTYDRDGWWAGVIARITKQGDYLVAFDDPPHVLVFPRDRLRLHRDFLNGRWSLPPKFSEFSDYLNELIALAEGHNTNNGKATEVCVTALIPCSIKQSTPNEMLTSSNVGSSEKETEQQSSRYDSLRFLPPKKKRKTLNEPSSENNCASQSKDTGTSNQKKRRRLVKLHARTENASRTGNKKGADEGSSAANELGFPVTPVEHLNASEKHSVAKVVEDVAGDRTNSGVKGSMLGELHSQVLDRSEHSRLGGVNQVNEAREIIQVEEDADLEGEIEGDTRPNQRPTLPFVKTSPVWKAVESLEVFQKFPQAPHFLPLSDSKAGCREGLAIAKMVTFANTVQMASKLKITDPKSRFTSCLEDLGELEVHGFDAQVIKSRLTRLLSIKDGLKKVDKKWDEAEAQISGLKNERVKIEEKIEKIIKEMRRFQDKLILALTEKEKKDFEITILSTSVDIMHEAVQSAQHEFEEHLNDLAR
ncbi:DUF724 domain-containing protein 10-like isoform X2 [Rhodamnia argentea]|uniref:DUF724 domain-containing protein 10-like isoform X2 n=1 Tax=Rhodamnia argentea TaxID=178133 RepID=A0A8B8PY72_9MYRT|nr:DUF724 domain-containing protein 10-like isoform X2 [Rhodamnia argentea]